MGDELGKPLDVLLPAAARSLEAEDARLRAAFDASPRPEERTRVLSRGLAYWVFETTLVHEIFKGWLPLVDVDHEVPYPASVADKADLVVFERGVPSVVVECKWWPNDRRETLEGLDGDIAKLRDWPGDVQRVLLTFWTSPDELAAHDWQSVLAFCEKRRGAAPVWHHRFPIHHYASRDRHFAIAALRVTPHI